jgi:hypothetical protein
MGCPCGPATQFLRYIYEPQVRKHDCDILPPGREESFLECCQHMQPSVAGAAESSHRFGVIGHADNEDA